MLHLAEIMITAMPAAPLRHLAVLLCPLLLGACASAPPPGPETPLREGLSRFGEFVEDTRTEELPRVILIRDRHVLHGAITRIRGAQRRLQRQNRDAIAFLLEKGYRFLGCEFTRGALPDGDGPERRHRTRAREIIAARDDLSAWTLYQPIRFEVEFGDRLVVEGVEDPELYRQHLDRLEAILEGQRRLRDPGLDEEEAAAIKAERRRQVRAIRRNVETRGRKAADNLLARLEERREQRAILMLGGSHASGALAALREAGASWLCFTPASYEDRDG